MSILKDNKKGEILAQESLYFLSILLLVLIAMELVFPRIVLVYFNINILLILIVVNAVYLLIKTK